MSDLVIQASFNSGEWSPTLRARVDIQKYRSGAAMLRNFFVDYRGGASTRPGTQYIQTCLNSTLAVRIIPFQASTTVSYVLEFGNGYLRFYNNGAPVLEGTKNITAATQSNPVVITSVAHGYNIGDWVLIQSVGGMTQLNGRYFQVGAPFTANQFGLFDLFGNTVNGTAYGAYTAGGTLRRVYTIVSPYAGNEVAQLKFAQNVGTMILCHPNHPPYQLILGSATSWSLTAITFGSTAVAPTGVTVTTSLAAGTINYAYVVTSVDSTGAESVASTPGTLLNMQDIRAVAGTNRITWTGAAGAVSYNVYKAELAYANAVAAGAQFGFIGTCTGLTFDDSNIAPDFTETPPIANNPFAGTGINKVQVTASGAYGSAPSLAFAAGTITAAGYPLMSVNGSGNTIFNAGTGYAAADIITLTTGTQIYINSVSGAGAILTFTVLNQGALVDTIPSNPIFVLPANTNGVGAGFNLLWGVTQVIVTNPGAYGAPPAVTFSSGAATATTALGAGPLGNPTVPGFFDQRLVMAGFTAGPQTFAMSRVGQYYNFNVSNPTQSDDAIEGSLVSGQLNSIKSMIPMPSGLVMFTDRQAWLVNGGSNGLPVSAVQINANSQSYNGSADLPPIVANFDVIYIQAKGSIARDLAYNIYANVYTGTDISVLSSHLFYGYSMLEWAWAEEPYKLVWTVRSDGVLLALTFLKEQEFTAWTHNDTKGLFRSVCTVTETVNGVRVDAVYVVVQRVIQNTAIQYIERLAERNLTEGINAAWCVDSGVQYAGAATANFSNAGNLAGQTVTGLADGVVIAPFTMPTTGAFTLATPAQNVIVGLAFLAQLQTLPLELGDPTVQGKVKKISTVDVRVADTLGLSIGSDFSHLVAMKDLVRGNVSSMLTGQSSQIVSGLYTGDARTTLDPTYTVPGQYCIQQSDPLPATVLGVIPEITIGDTGSRGGGR